MFTKVNTITIQGIEAINIEVQVCITPGMPCFNIVGLPDKTIAESKERVRAAITAIGMQFPPKRITVNLAPANIFKIGNHYDLPIALGIISLINEYNFNLEEYIVMGELALNGNITSVCSVLPAAIYASELEIGIICPFKNGVEAKISKNKKILAATNLIQLLKCLKMEENPLDITEQFTIEEEESLDFLDVKGQESAKRAMEIAAAGGHNLLMQGPPGTGKSMLAKRMISILPPLERKEILEINLIASIIGKFKNLIYKNRPFREPHHSCSMASMVGGGKFSCPGEITIAHNGLLFLDELPEFSRPVLEALRQPLEDRKVTISRVNVKITYPANFQLIAAMNPCKCGYLGSNCGKVCKYAPQCGTEYKNKISGPILDRFDIFVEVSNVDIFQLYEKKVESSAIIKKRVARARKLQKDRYEAYQIKINSNMNTEMIEKFISLEEESINVLKKAVQNNYLSMRGYNKILKLARTIADLDHSENVKKYHVMEALHYRLGQ